MEWIEAEGKTRAEAETKLLETLGVDDLGKIEVEDVKVKRVFLGMGGRIIKLRGRLKDQPAIEPLAKETAQTEQSAPEEREAGETTPADHDKTVESPPSNGVVTGTTKYRPWVAEGPGAIVLPPEGKGYSRRKYNPNPVFEDEEKKPRVSLDKREDDDPKDISTEDDFVPPVYEDAEESPVTEEDRDRATQFVSAVIEKMGMKGEVKGYKLSDRLLIQIESESGGLLIGRKGFTLDSLQYLTDIIVNRRREGRIRIIIDTEHYKERRRFKIYKIATAAAGKAAASHKPVRLYPMSPSERQIVHATLADDERVETISEGEGDHRRVVVFPRDKRPGRYAD